MGNRGGRIHDPASYALLPSRRWASRRWICCVLEFRERHRTVMGPGYTELFFLDEVTALTAGHRPCFECRRADARTFADAWAVAFDLSEPPKADAMDAVLHSERTAPQNTLTAIDACPDGAMAQTGDGRMFAMRNGEALWWSPTGYGIGPRPQHARLLTPPAMLEVLSAGYRPAWHPSAEAGC